jgi:hypothetical protein
VRIRSARRGGALSELPKSLKIENRIDKKIIEVSKVASINPRVVESEVNLRFYLGLTSAMRDNNDLEKLIR